MGNNSLCVFVAIRSNKSTQHTQVLENYDNFHIHTTTSLFISDRKSSHHYQLQNEYWYNH